MFFPHEMGECCFLPIYTEHIAPQRWIPQTAKFLGSVNRPFFSEEQIFMRAKNLTAQKEIVKVINNYNLTKY